MCSYGTSSTVRLSLPPGAPRTTLSPAIDLMSLDRLARYAEPPRHLTLASTFHQHRSPHTPVDLHPEHPSGVPRSRCFRNSPWKPPQAVDYFYTATAHRSHSVLWPIFTPAVILSVRTFHRGGVPAGLMAGDQSTFKGNSPIGRDGARWCLNRVSFRIEQKRQAKGCVQHGCETACFERRYTVTGRD